MPRNCLYHSRHRQLQNLTVVVRGDVSSNPNDLQPSYGYVADDTKQRSRLYQYDLNRNRFSPLRSIKYMFNFNHSYQLGSTSYITNQQGNITQYDAYLPYGELLVDEHCSSDEMPYKFFP